MAVLSKIRDRKLLLIALIGLALLVFVVGIDGNSSFQNNDPRVVGEVNGEKITRDEFNAQVENYKAQSRGRNVSDIQTINYVWENILRQKVYDAQVQKAGVVVGEYDVWQGILPYFQNNPNYQNEVGGLDEEKIKNFIADLRESAEGSDKGSSDQMMWLNWLNTEKAVSEGVANKTYMDLVKAGLYTTVTEGKRDFLYKNTTISSDLVFVPYTSVEDSEVEVSDADYQSFINANPKRFEVEASRNLEFVKFDIKASDEDKAELKKEVSGLISQFEAAEDNQEFANELGSDIALNESYSFKNQLNFEIRDAVYEGGVNKVVGPYEESGAYKLAKVMAFKTLPDSVSASHILIPFVGSRAANQQTRLSKEQAKAQADSLATVVKASPSKFADLAGEFSQDKSNASKGGDLGWFTYRAMVPEFRDYCFENKKGDIGVVETMFGYHIIKIEDQKNFQEAAKLAYFGRNILPSEVTEANYYQEAEVFASKVTSGENFNEVATEKGYTVYPANKLKELDENVPGISGTNRLIVRWAFDAETPVGSVRRFDLDNGYVVVTLASKTEAGLAKVDDVATEIKQEIVNEKKAAIIKDKMRGTSIQAIADATKTNQMTVSNVSLASPVITSVGSEPGVVGAMSTASIDELVVGVSGNKGVFAFQVKSRNAPAELASYQSFVDRISKQVQGRSSKIYDALKEESDIQDYRSIMF